MNHRNNSIRAAAPGTRSDQAPGVGEPGNGAVTFEAVRDNPRVKVFIRSADSALEVIGYTEHGERHVGLVAHIAYNTLKRLGHPEREAELAAIAGYLHDIGNAVKPRGPCRDRGGHGHAHPDRPWHARRRGSRRSWARSATTTRPTGPPSARSRRRHPGGQERRAPHPGAQPGHDQVRPCNDRVNYAVEKSF